MFYSFQNRAKQLRWLRLHATWRTEHLVFSNLHKWIHVFYTIVLWACYDLERERSIIQTVEHHWIEHLSRKDLWSFTSAICWHTLRFLCYNGWCMQCSKLTNIFTSKVFSQLKGTSIIYWSYWTLVRPHTIRGESFLSSVENIK